ncbi:MAG: hypothetical protein MZV70_01305 [Desulfobacterales bacterium]|nr:hypothetical protein [Desulfobacterales bacterium]
MVGFLKGATATDGATFEVHVFDQATGDHPAHRRQDRPGRRRPRRALGRSRRLCRQDRDLPAPGRAPARPPARTGPSGRRPRSPRMTGRSQQDARPAP